MKIENKKSEGKIILVAASIFLFAGCNLLQPPPLPPPPPAAWNAAPGFSPDSINKTAIFVDGGDAFATEIEDAFITAAFRKGYRVSDRSDVDKVLQEIRFQQSGLTESDAARLGKMLNVPAVLIVKIRGAGVNSQQTGLILNNQVQYNYVAWCEMSVRLISVEKAEVLGLADYGSRRYTDSRQNVNPAVYFDALQLAQALPARDSQ
jgi:uncharacterized lipoprotein YajG